MVKTHRIYLIWAWIGTVSWRTDRRTDGRTERQNRHSLYALSSTCRYSCRT